MKDPRLNILIIAHELSPEQGSECAVGWNMVVNLSRYHDITVVYASSSQANQNNAYLNAVNKYLNTHAPLQIDFINVSQPRTTIFIAKLNRLFNKLGPTGLPMLYYLGYKYWHKSAFRKAQQLHKIKLFDAVHQLTQISFREPGYSYKLGIPFFWGPMGGTSSLPKKIYESLPLHFKFLENVRRFSKFYHFLLVKRLKEANKKASIIYSFTELDAKRFRKIATGKVKIMLDVGTHVHSEIPKMHTKENGVLKAIWCGRLSTYKAPEILLKAIALSEVIKKNVHFQIIGNGPLEESLHNMAVNLGIENIEWIRQVNHDEVFMLFSQADFFIHTSLREATSSVIPEALSMGLPVICHDAYGMSIAVNEKCGIKIPFVSPEDSVVGFQKAIEKFTSDNELLTDMKVEARKRALELTWEKMACIIAEDYIEIINKNQESNLKN